MSQLPKPFRATLVLAAGPLKWTGIRIPFDAAKLWKTRGQIRVRGSINGFEFCTTLFPTGDGGHFLLVNKTMQKSGHVQRGDVARFELEPDSQERPVVTPAELEKFFKQDKAMRKFFNEWSDSGKRWVANEIASRKTPASRERRAEQIAEQTLETMDAERELPPLIRRAFDENPKARTAWNRLTPLQRRQYLYAIFYYRTPVSRARRLEKAIAAMTGKIKE